MTYELIDIESWARKEQFEFFRTFDEPFTGVVVNVNVSNAYQFYKAKGLSFFQVYLHKCLEACISTRALRLRIVEGQVRDYKQVHASAVIMREDHSFGFSHIEYNTDFKLFSDNVLKEKQRVKSDRSLFPPVNKPNVIHVSAMPWIQFTGLSHARKYNSGDTCPKISFGKVFEENGNKLMPVSLHVHHALVDGRDMGEFIESFQKALNTI